MRFLIDECLTVDLVGVANRGGYYAEHVVRIGRAGWGDWNLARYAQDGEFVLVTNNAEDFRRLYAEMPFHPGLVILVPNVKLQRQVALFDAALTLLATEGEPLNQVLEIDLAGDEIVFNLYDLPSSS